MEELVTKIVTQQDEAKKTTQTISIFIINNKSEMLLHKKSPSSDTEKTSWQLPCFLHHDMAVNPTHRAKEYIDQLGITCELYEAFTLNPLPPHINETTQLSNHHIIALASNHESQLHFATESYKWMTFNNLFQVIHEYPTHYASWLGTTLEGVQLYVKNIFKNQPFNHTPAHVQFR